MRAWLEVHLLFRITINWTLHWIEMCVWLVGDVIFSPKDSGAYARDTPISISATNAAYICMNVLNNSTNEVAVPVCDSTSAGQECVSPAVRYNGTMSLGMEVTQHAMQWMGYLTSLHCEGPWAGCLNKHVCVCVCVCVLKVSRWCACVCECVMSGEWEVRDV
jgi:hypothetical protein